MLHMIFLCFGVSWHFLFGKYRKKNQLSSRAKRLCPGVAECKVCKSVLQCTLNLVDCTPDEKLNPGYLPNMKNKRFAVCPNCGLKHQYITKAIYTCKCGTKFPLDKKGPVFGVDGKKAKQIAVFVAPIAFSAFRDIFSQIFKYGFSIIKFFGFLAHCVFLAFKRVMRLFAG